MQIILQLQFFKVVSTCETVEYQNQFSFLNWSLLLIRIRLNNTQDILVVPLEVEVSSEVVPYPPYGPIDFGVGGISDQPKSVKLFLQSPTRRPIHIQSVKTTSKAIKIFLEGSKFPTDMKIFKKQLQPFAVATLTLDCKFFGS